MAPALDVIVLQHGHSSLTVALIESIHATYDPARVILVDNGSPRDHLIAAGLALHSTDVLIANAENDGYIRGCNQGLEVSTAPFVCLQNNDTLMYAGGYERMIAHLQRHTMLGAVGPICNANASYQSLSHQQDAAQALGHLAEEDRAEVALRVFEGQLRFDGGPGVLAFFCTVLPRHIVDQVGLLDEQFGAGYAADDDYCIRIRNAGYRVGIASDVYVYHEQRVTQREVLGGLEGIDAEGQRALATLRAKHT